MPGVPGRPFGVDTPQVPLVHVVGVLRFAQDVRQPFDGLRTEVDDHGKRCSLFDGNGLCEIARLIDVFAFDIGNVIRQEL